MCFYYFFSYKEQKSIFKNGWRSNSRYLTNFEKSRESIICEKLFNRWYFLYKKIT